MEGLHPSPQQDEWASATPEAPDTIVLPELEAEPTGFALIEAKYGHDPDHLAQNTALVLFLLAQETEKTVLLNHDSSMLGQKTQTILDDIVLSLAFDEKRTGVAQLFESFTMSSGYAAEKLKKELQEFVEFKNHYLENFSLTRAENRYAHHAKLKDDLYLLRYMSNCYIDGVVDRINLSSEGGDMDGFDLELFYAYCWQFVYEDPHAEVSESDPSSGLSGQVHKRLVIEAHHIFSSPQTLRV